MVVGTGPRVGRMGVIELGGRVAVTRLFSGLLGISPLVIFGGELSSSVGPSGLKGSTSMFPRSVWGSGWCPRVYFILFCFVFILLFIVWGGFVCGCCVCAGCRCQGRRFYGSFSPLPFVCCSTQLSIIFRGFSYFTYLWASASIS